MLLMYVESDLDDLGCLVDVEGPVFHSRPSTANKTFIAVPLYGSPASQPKPYCSPSKPWIKNCDLKPFIPCVYTVQMCSMRYTWVITRVCMWVCVPTNVSWVRVLKTLKLLRVRFTVWMDGWLYGWLTCGDFGYSHSHQAFQWLSSRRYSNDAKKITLPVWKNHQLVLVSEEVRGRNSILTQYLKLYPFYIHTNV